MSSVYKEKLSDKLMDLGNLVIAGIVLSQFVGNNQINFGIMFVGIVATLFCYVIAYLII